MRIGMYVTGLALAFGMASPTSAVLIPPAANIALNKPYAYFDTVPGEGLFYQDDTHAVHSAGLGVFSTGQLTDGIVQTGLPADQALIPSPDISFLGTPGRVIIGLGAAYAIDTITLGTNRNGSLANFRPENVNLLLSTAGFAPSDFGAPVTWDIPTLATNGQATFAYSLGSTAPARYLQLDFATPGQPTHEIHFDEVSVYGVAVPEPATLGLLAVGAMLMLQRRRGN
jgi:hypothetical protein